MKKEEVIVAEGATLDYVALIKRLPWLLERDQDCILSPDSDGLLCGLFMSHVLGWKVRGFYDGKILLLEKGFKARDCVFLDMEIFRKGVRSVGQHMVMYDRDRTPANWPQFDACLSANNIRGYDMKHEFARKYPFGTIHLLLAVIGKSKKFKIPVSGICPLLYTDGTFKNLFNYPDNCLSWLKFLGGDMAESPLHGIFFNDHYTISALMLALKDSFGELRILADGKRGGDKIKFSSSKGALVNFNQDEGAFAGKTYEMAQKFLRILSDRTGWEYHESAWTWRDLVAARFQKGSIKPGRARYEALLEKNPLSFAIISGLSIEHAFDPKNLFE